MVIQALLYQSHREAKKAQVKVRLKSFLHRAASFSIRRMPKTVSRNTSTSYSSADAMKHHARIKEDIQDGGHIHRPFVLTGGELPAMIMIDCISRQIEGCSAILIRAKKSVLQARIIYSTGSFQIQRQELPRAESPAFWQPQALDEWKRGKK